MENSLPVELFKPVISHSTEKILIAQTNNKCKIYAAGLEKLWWTLTFLFCITTEAVYFTYLGLSVE